MSDNPLENTPERQACIRRRAKKLWEADGRPAGREAEYRERAEFLIGIEDNPQGGQIAPDARTDDDAVEEAEIAENLGEFPALSDQGERRETPFTRDEEHEWEAGKRQPTRGDAP